MKQIIYVILIAILFGCNNNRNEIKQKDSEELTDSTNLSFVNVFDTIKVESEKFYINSQKDTLIICEKGTKIFIEANSFETNSDKVELKIQEFYSKKDFISEDLTTISNNQLLESGGMLRINAFAKNKKVLLKKGKEITIAFPKKEQNKQMSLFYGERDSLDNINWIEGQKQLKNQNKKQTIVDTIYDYRLTMSTWLTFGYPGLCLYYDTLGKRYWIYDYFNKFYSPKISIDETIPDKFNFVIYVKFTLNDKTQIDNIEFDNDGYTTEYNAFIYNFLKSLPPISYKETVDMFKKNSKYMIQQRNSMKKKKYFIDFHIEKLVNISKFRKNIKSSKKPKLKIDDLNYYVFATSKLDWINCDRFLNYKKSDMISFKVKLDSLDETVVYMIFNNVNSILKGEKLNNEFVFNNIPKNTPVKLVVIKSPNTNAKMAFKETTTDMKNISITEFEKFDLNKFDQILN